MIVSPTFSLVGVGVWRVGDGRPFGVLCVVWGALAAVAAARPETAQNCIQYRVNPHASTPPVYMDTKTTVDLTVKADGTPTQESQTVLNLSVGSETIKILVWDREAHCNDGRPRPNGKAYNITEEGKEGLYRFFFYNKTLYINGIDVCKNVNIDADVPLKVERASDNVTVIFNCVSDYNCNFDNESLTLDPATAKGTSYVQTLSRGATADIEVFDCPDKARNLVACDSLIKDKLKREDIEGEAYKGNWQRLHFSPYDLQERDE
ncbi:uncharacterized protein LOC134787745, partial [Penaeus indicus]|uniref:uncharacterized protein LOC134787745 n=1 Tax=Penaeus indicus TaxID=29960 RepID=UPI00300C8286